MLRKMKTLSSRIEDASNWFLESVPTDESIIINCKQSGIEEAYRVASKVGISVFDDIRLIEGRGW